MISPVWIQECFSPAMQRMARDGNLITSTSPLVSQLGERAVVYGVGTPRAERIFAR